MLKCTVCLDPYTNPNKPKILPCGHSFCTNCISEIYKITDTLCPRCKAPMPNQTNLPINYDLYASAETPTVNIQVYRIMVLGNSFMGKTCIIHCFKYKVNMTDEQLKSNNVTISPDLITSFENVNGVSSLVEVWDSPGATDINAMYKSRLKKAHCCILVCDVSNKSTLDGCDNRHKAITAENAHVNYVLFVNKCDLPIEKMIYQNL